MENNSQDRIEGASDFVLPEEETSASDEEMTDEIPPALPSLTRQLGFYRTETSTQDIADFPPFMLPPAANPIALSQTLSLLINPPVDRNDINEEQLDLVGDYAPDNNTIYAAPAA